MADEEPISLNADLCCVRFEGLLERWEKVEQLSKCEALLIITGKSQSDDLGVLEQLHLWLFGLIFPDTLVIFLKKQRKIIFAARTKKLQYFLALKDSTVATKGKFDLAFLERSAYSPETSAAHAKEVEAILSEVNKIGVFLEEDNLPKSAPAQELLTALGVPSASDSPPPEKSSSSKFDFIGVDKELHKLSLIWDQVGLENVKLASIVGSRLAKEVLINEVVNILDKETAKSHAKIVAMADKAVEDESRMKKWQQKFGINKALWDIQYATIESGKKFYLDPAIGPNNSNLNLGKGSVVIAVGAKYNGYNSSVARTLFLALPGKAKRFCEDSLKCQAFMIETAVVAGKTFEAVFLETKKYIEENFGDLFKYLSLDDFGGAVGFGESKLLFKEGSLETIEPNMTVTVSLKFKDCECQGYVFSMWLCDTVLIQPEGEQPKVLTGQVSKKLEDVFYELHEEEEETSSPGKENNHHSSSREPRSKGEQTSSSSKSSKNKSGGGGSNPVSPSVRQTRARSRRQAAGINQQELEKLMEKQRKLRRAKLDELRERFRNGAQVGITQDKKDVRKMSRIVTYRDAAEFPRELRPNKFYVDQSKEAVLIPVGKIHVPFHVSTLRNVTHQEEGDGKSQRVKFAFHVPGTTGSKIEESPLPDLGSVPNALFIREIVLRTCDPNSLTLFKTLRDLMKRVKTKELNRPDELETQQVLQLNRTGRRIMLRNLMVRHTAGHSRRVIGVLEAHVNGLRYQATRSETIDLIYANIKHAFFQPVGKELIVLVHFQLKAPILINKKKVTDIQFFTEAANQTDDLDTRRHRAAYDPDEILEEQREHERKQKLNLEFKRFVEKVQEMSTFQFEVPMKDLGFYGVPKNSSVFLTPTASCLVHLTEWPTCVISLEDVELVSFERVIHGLRHFDMIFIYKDYNRSVSSITSIGVDSLEQIKGWLNSIDFVWYEGKGNLNWQAILKTIKADIHGFIEEGGYSMFLGDSNDLPTPGRNKNDDDEVAVRRVKAEEDDEDDEDEDYEESDSSSDDDDDDEEEEDDVDDDDDDDDDDSEGGGSEEDAEEEGSDDGMTWEELENQAKHSDKKRQRPVDLKNSSSASSPTDKKKRKNH